VPGALWPIGSPVPPDLARHLPCVAYSFGKNDDRIAATEMVRFALRSYVPITTMDRFTFSTYRAATIMMKIAVVGATGPTGLHLVTELRKTIAAARVIARGMDKSSSYFLRRQLKSGKPIFAPANANSGGCRGLRHRLRLHRPAR
jgi:hypothetical protein